MYPGGLDRHADALLTLIYPKAKKVHGVMIVLLKCHGSGNDFILVDELCEPLPLDETERVRLVQLVCDRQGPLGSDGVLFFQASDKADCRMRMFNTDGSEAEMCGNGLRCIGRYYLDQHQETQKVRVETMKAVLAVDNAKPLITNLPTFSAEICPISLDPASLPMAVEAPRFIDRKIAFLGQNFSALTVPNPHIIALVEELDDEVLSACGAKANDCTLFPKGVNVSFVKVLAEGEIFSATYERGVGLTNACGTAMSASAYITALLKEWPESRPITVYNKGGMVICQKGRTPDGVEKIMLSGNATRLFRATIEVGEALNSITDLKQETLFQHEEAAYDALKAKALQRLNQPT